MPDELLLAGKPISHFYKLPFESTTRVLYLQVLELHKPLRAGNRTNFRLENKFISFRKGVLTIRVKWEREPAEKVFLRVEYDHLLVSCSADTNRSYLGKQAYHALRAMMRDGAYDFQRFYWPACFDESTGRSKYLDLTSDRYGAAITLKKRFEGLFRPGDVFLQLSERHVWKRNVLRDAVNFAGIANEIGYCLAYTDPVRDHYPFLLPFACTPNADQQTVKSFTHFLYEDTVRAPQLRLSVQQMALNSICYKMKHAAQIRKVAEKENTQVESAKIAALNTKTRSRILELFHLALPLLAAAPFAHSCYTYRMRNVRKKPIKKEMQPCRFSMAVPHLHFLLTDKGDYFELLLQFIVKGKVLTIDPNPIALYLICSAANPSLWYLVESDMDMHVLHFFSRTNFKIQIPKAYYSTHFAQHVDDLKKLYTIAYT